MARSLARRADSARGQRRPGRPGFDDHQLVRRGHDGARIGHHLAVHDRCGLRAGTGRSPKTTDAARPEPSSQRTARGPRRGPSLPRDPPPGVIRAHGPAPTTKAPRPQWLHRGGSSRGRAVEHTGRLGQKRGEETDLDGRLVRPNRRGGARLIVEAGASAGERSARGNATGPAAHHGGGPWPPSPSPGPMVLRGRHRSQRLPPGIRTVDTTAPARR